MRLLVDLAKEWPVGEKEWRSSAVVSKLNLLEDAPWIELGKKGLSTTRLARMLRPFKVVPTRENHQEPKRYHLPNVHAVWLQYGRASSCVVCSVTRGLPP